MTTVTRDEFEGRASDLLRAAKEGEVVQIVESDGPVLELRALDSSRAANPTREEAEAIWKEIIEFRDALPRTVTLQELMEWRREGLRY